MNIEEISRKEDLVKNGINDIIIQGRKEGIGEIEIFCSYSQNSEITLEKNDINQSTYSEETMYGIRVIANHCQGFAATNDINSLMDTVHNARSIALAQNTPDDAMELPQPGLLAEIEGLYQPELDEVTPEIILDLIRESLDLKNSDFPVISIDNAEFGISRGFKIIANSNGVLASEKEAALYSSFMGMASANGVVGSFDYDSAYGRTFPEFKNNHLELFQEFMKNCVNSLKAVNQKSFRGKLIVPPRNISGFLLGNLLSSVTAPMVRKGKSRFAGKKGEKVASNQLSVTDDPTIPDYMSSTSFDREGMATEKKQILQNGVLQDYFYNHYEAKKAGLTDSCNALGGASSVPGCGPRQLQVESGGAMLDEIMNLENAIVLNRFSGSSDFASGDFSGVVKGGSVIKNGEQIPVKEIQIAGNIYDCLHNISHVSHERKLLHNSSLMPWVVIEDVDITGT